MSKIQKASIYFLLIMGTAMLVHILCSRLVSNENLSKLPKVAMMLWVMLASFWASKREGVSLSSVKLNWDRSVWFIAFSLMMAFATVNIIQKYVFDMDFGYDQSKYLFFLGYFAITSSSEEILYRGFLQNYIDMDALYTNAITKGNIYSSILMTLTHLGFFGVMDLGSAILAVLLVFVYSIGVGVIFHKTKSLLLACILHILMNWIHLSIQVF